MDAVGRRCVEWASGQNGTPVLAVVGWVSSVVASFFMVSGGGMYPYIGMGVTGIVMGLLYGVTYFYAVKRNLRDHRQMRRNERGQRAWYVNALGNCCVSIVTIPISVAVGLAGSDSIFWLAKTSDTIVGLLLMALSVFVLIDIAKPMFDFGLLQYFLRLPVQAAMAWLLQHLLGIVPLVPCLVVLILCTLWTAYALDRYPQLPPNREGSLHQPLLAGQTQLEGQISQPSTDQGVLPQSTSDQGLPSPTPVKEEEGPFEEADEQSQSVGPLQPPLSQTSPTTMEPTEPKVESFEEDKDADDQQQSAGQVQPPFSSTPPTNVEPTKPEEKLD